MMGRGSLGPMICPLMSLLLLGAAVDGTTPVARAQGTSPWSAGQPIRRRSAEKTGPSRSETGTETPLPTLPPHSELKSGDGPRLLPLRPSLHRTVGSVLVVLGGCWVALHFAAGRRRNSGLEAHGIVELLGQWPIAGKHQLHLVRIGSRLLLLAAAQDSLTCLLEINEPAEVERVMSACGTGNGHLPFPLARITQQHSSSQHLGR